MRKLTLTLIAMGIALVFAAAACAGETEVVKEVVTVEVERVVEKEVVREVPVEKIVTVEVVMEKEVVREVPVEKEVVREVEVEKIVEVEKVVVVEKEVEVLKEIVKEVIVEKVVTVEKEVVMVKTVEVEKDLPEYQEAELTKFGGTLRVASQGSLSMLDPIASTAAAEKAIANHIWDTLFETDLAQNILPMMVDTWDISSDGLTYTMTLREGLTFHDGSPIGTDDVIPSLSRYMDSISASGRTFKGFLAADALNKVDSLTFTIALIEPFGPGIGAFRHDSFVGPFVFPEEVGRLEATTPMDEENYFLGSGPYKLSEWLRGDRVELVRHEGYNSRSEPANYRAGRRAQYLDKIVYLEVPSEETKIAGLKTGLYDVVEVAGLDFFDTLEAHPDINVKVGGARASGLWFNLANPDSIMTRDVKIRQALLAGMNMEDFMASLGPQELWWLCSHRYGPCLGKSWTWENRAADSLYDQNDLPRAMQLLAESTYDGELVHIMSPTDYATITPLGPVLKAVMEEIGFTVEMPAINWANLLSRLGSDDWDLITSWTFIGIGPLTDDFLDLGYGFVQGWDDATLPGLKAQYLRATDQEEQMAIAEQIQLYYYDVIPWLQIGYFAAPDAYRTRVQGMGDEQANVFEIYYANVWLSE